MKQLKSLLTQLLLITSLLLPWAATEAAEPFVKAGFITKVNAATINLYHYDIDFRIGSDAKIEIPNVSNPRMSDFKKGDQVYMEGKILNGVYYVDWILYLPETPG